MIRRTILAATLAALALPASAQQTMKIGLILPMTGPSQSTGKQIDAAVKLYIAQHGDTVAGRKIEIILRDDAGVADTTKRLAQELIVRDKVAALAGFGLTPLAMATAPLAAQAKVPMVVMAAACVFMTPKSVLADRHPICPCQGSNCLIAESVSHCQGAPPNRRQCQCQ